MKRSLTRETNTLLDDVVKKLVGNIDVIKIVLFGSYSTGLYTAEVIACGCSTTVTSVRGSG